MAKVSKNIKKLRKEQKLTQEALADKIHITRQAVSNWENDKTQPDIESLKALSVALNVEIEELIYGKKRQVGTEVDPERSKNKMKIILAIAGSLFLGIGFVLIFVNFWQDFSLVLKAGLSVIPMLAGQAFSVYVFLRRRESFSWRESAATLWCMGAVATVALINAVFDIHCGVRNCLFIDIILCMPIFWLLDAVSPLIVYYYMIIHWTSLSGSGIIALIMFSAGLLFVFAHRKNSEDVRYKYTLWISTLATPAIIMSSFEFEASVFLVFASFIMLYAGSAGAYDLTRPAKPVGILGASVILSGISGMMLYEACDSASDSLFEITLRDTELIKMMIVPIVISAVMIAVGIIVGRESYKSNTYKIILTALPTAVFLCTAVLVIADIPFLGFPIFLFTCAFGVSLIIKGVRELHFLVVNLGLLVCFSQLMTLIAVIMPSLLVLGLAFVVFGALLIGINIKLSAQKKESLVAESEEEEE